MKAIIVGAGVSGLCTSIYLAKAGYEVSVYEKNKKAGGLCASFKRGDYTFDSCINWILGSSDGSEFEKLWREVIDLDKLSFIYHDSKLIIETKDNCDKYGSYQFPIYSDIYKLRYHLYDIAKEDKAMIDKLINSIEKIWHNPMPPMIEIAPTQRTIFKQLSLLRYMPLVLFMNQWTNETNITFAKKLKNPFLKEVFELFYDGEEYSLLAVTMQLAYFHKKAVGYPIGGSGAFVNELLNKTKEYNISIEYEKNVDEILIKNNMANGVIFKDGERKKADVVISCVDFSYTHKKLLKEKYITSDVSDLINGKIYKIYDSCIMVYFGVDKNLNDLPHLIRFPLENPLRLPNGKVVKRAQANIFNYDKTMARKGGCVICTTIKVKDFVYFKDLYENRQKDYIKLKEIIIEHLKKEYDLRYGDISSHIKEVEVITPVTINRYTNSYEGSTQGFLPNKDLLSKSKVMPKVLSLSNFYMISQWNEPGGGLPVCVKQAKYVTSQIIEEIHNP